MSALNIIVTCGSPTHQQIIEDVFTSFPVKYCAAIYYDQKFSLNTTQPIEWLPYRQVLQAEYQVDWNSLDPLDEALLERMAVAETTVLRMMERSGGTELTYGQRKHLYLQHLRYWHHLIRHRKISFCLLMNLPHDVYDYIIYELCRTMNVPVLCLYQGRVVDTVLLVSDWQNSMQKVQARYKKLLRQYQKNHQTIQLASKFKEQLVTQTQTSTLNRTLFYMKPRYLFKQQLVTLLIYIREVGLKFWQQPSWILSRAVNPFFWLNKISAVIREYWLRYVYASLAKNPDLTQKYIFVPLHFQPELTTSPLAGEYVEQELIVSLLSYCLPPSIKIYVKEHPRQTGLMRSANFYHQLAATSQVTLVPRTFSSSELISHTIAVATATGTAGWEALLVGRPVLMFGHDVYQFAPGVFSVRTVQDCQEALNTIRTQKRISTKREITIFLRALQDTLIEGYIDENYQSFSQLTVEQNISNLSKAIRQYLKQHLQNNETIV